MIVLKGQKVSEGIAFGRATILTAREVQVKESHVGAEDVDREIRRLRRALQKAGEDIRLLLDDQDEELVEVRQILETPLHFLQDQFLVRAIEKKIREERYTAAYAVSRTLAEMSERLQAIDNPTIASKVSDMIDIEHRLLGHLIGGGVGQVPKLDRQYVIIADDITPTQAAALDRSRVLGFATERGSWASHTAILARALDIPAVVGVPGVARAVSYGSEVIIDGNEGLVLVDPDAEAIDRYRSQRRKLRRRTHSSTQSRQLPSVTQDGEVCRLQGNIETKEDVSRVLEFGGEGVGLFRTEFIFLGRREEPTEDEQYAIYREAIEGMAGRPVTIRTIDVGGDKFDARQVGEVEPNPFMGERSIRVSLKRTRMFRNQLRAVLRAAAHGPVRLMFPLVMDIAELRRAKEQLDLSRQELRERGLDGDVAISVGTMVELPSAALGSSAIAREVDFLSIGTNDLTQYTLGVDRTNHRVAGLYAPHHPAVLHLIGEVVGAGRAAGIPVSVCGEMGAEPRFTPLLIGLGVREFSVSPPRIPQVKRALRGVDSRRCEDLAARALSAGYAGEVDDLLLDFRR